MVLLPDKNCSSRNCKAWLEGAENGFRFHSFHQLFHFYHEELYPASADLLLDLLSIWITPSERPFTLKVSLIWAKWLSPLCSREYSVFLGGDWVISYYVAPAILDTKSVSDKLVLPFTFLFPLAELFETSVDQSEWRKLTGLDDDCSTNLKGHPLSLPVSLVSSCSIP